MRPSPISKPGIPTFDSSPNAFTKAATTVDGAHTYGIQPHLQRLNEMPSEPDAYTIGVHQDIGQEDVLEDTYAFVVDYAGIRGQGFFAIFDGHSGKHAAEWCGQTFHEYLLKELAKNNQDPIPYDIAGAFLAVDCQLTAMSEAGITSSGCTAVTAFLRLEDANGKQPFPTINLQSLLPPTGEPTGGGRASNGPIWLRDLLAGRKGRSRPGKEASPVPALNLPGDVRRVLYTANVGDARAVLARAGKAIRLSYDHKGNDTKEVMRIRESGGYVRRNRVFGSLSVTRSLGDSAWKDYVIGKPYTMECELGGEDQWLILACDGLWDIVDDQAAVDLIQGLPSAQRAAETLVRHAVENFSRDSVTALVVKLSS